MYLLRLAPAAVLSLTLAGAPVFAQDQMANTGQTGAMAQTMGMGQSRNMAPNADFAYMANSSGTFEILSSQLALKKSKNPDVRKYAQKMIEDHTKASAGLKTAAASEGLDPHPALLDRKHAEMFDRLKTASHDDFDDLYMDLQTSAHDEATSLFKNYADNGPQGALKDYAAKTLPTLTAHHEHIKTLDKRN